MRLNQKNLKTIACILTTNIYTSTALRTHLHTYTPAYVHIRICIINLHSEQLVAGNFFFPSFILLYFLMDFIIVFPRTLFTNLLYIYLLCLFIHLSIYL